jgi:hypothetical protein
MRLLHLPKGIMRVWKKFKASIVQDCPAELFACEVCDNLDCTDEEYSHCGRRLAVARYVEARY